MICPTCGRPCAANVAGAVQCCGNAIVVHASPGVPPTPPKRQPVAPTHAVCNPSCPAWGVVDGCTGCTLIPQVVEAPFPRKPGDVGYYQRLGYPCFKDPPRYGASWGKDLAVDQLPDDCLIVTGSDHRYIRGVYFLAWTLMRANRVQMLAYLDDVPADDPHVTQMRSWGVRFRPMPLDVDRSVFFYQTWNKAASIADAMGTADRVLWLDSDTSISGSLRPLFDMIANHPVAPDHGRHKSKHENAPEVHRLLGKPKRTFAEGKHPCAGILGFHSQRDRELIEEWRRRCRLISGRPEMYKPFYTSGIDQSPLKYHDQGVITDLWEWECVDGIEWSNFDCMREGPLHKVMEKNFTTQGVIKHYGGAVKPFFDWPKVLKWGSPQ